MAQQSFMPGAPGAGEALAEAIEAGRFPNVGLTQSRALRVALSAARSTELTPLVGNWLYVETLAGSLQVAFNDPQGHYFTLREGEVYRVPFGVTFLTNAAQANGGIAVLVAGTGDFDHVATPRRRPVVVYPATGSGAISLTTAEARRFRLIQATIKFNTLPTTSEDATLALDAADGAAYDAMLARVDPSLGSGTGDVVCQGDESDVYEAGDELTLAYTNTDGRTYGARIVVEPV